MTRTEIVKAARERYPIKPGCCANEKRLLLHLRAKYIERELAKREEIINSQTSKLVDAK